MRRAVISRTLRGGIRGFADNAKGTKPSSQSPLVGSAQKPVAPKSPTPTGGPSNPSSPVDPRLLGAGGVAAAAATMYYFFSKDDTPSEKSESSASEESDSYAQTAVISDSFDNPSDGSGTSEASNSDSPSNSTEAEDAAAEKTAEDTSEAEEAEPIKYMDAKEVLSVLQDVLSKDGAQLLQDDTDALSQAQSKQENPTPTITEQKAAEKVEAVQSVISMGMADTAGETVATTIGRPSADELAQQAAEKHTVAVADNKNKKNTTSSSDPVLDILGLGVAPISAAGLIAAGNKHQDNNKHQEDVDWEAFKHHHVQAVRDAATMHTVLTTAATNVRSRLEEADAQVAAAREEADRIREAAKAQQAKFKSMLQAALQEREEKRKQDLNLQAEQLTLAHAENTVRERIERQQQLDALRMKLDAVEVALEKRAAESRTAHSVHKMSVGAFALQDALNDSTATLKEPVEFLKHTAAEQKDELVSKVLETIPTSVANTTRPQLYDSFDSVEQAVRELSSIPQGAGGGVFTVAAAKLAAKLKIKERGDVVLDTNGGVDTRLAAARDALTRGELLAAAKILEKAVENTAAAPAVADWVREAKARVVAEQAAAVVEARAATLAASLA